MSGSFLPHQNGSQATDATVENKGGVRLHSHRRTVVAGGVETRKAAIRGVIGGGRCKRLVRDTEKASVKSAPMK